MKLRRAAAETGNLFDKKYRVYINRSAASSSTLRGMFAQEVRH